MDITNQNELLNEITDKELETLNCPTLEAQNKCWTDILGKISDETLGYTLKMLNYKLQDYKISSDSNGFINKIVFITAIDNVTEENCELVLRLRNPVVYANDNITESEVAIMKFLKQNTSIPVPKIISYSCSIENQFNCNYILMEKLGGKTLKEVINQNPDFYILESLVDEILNVIKLLHSLNLHPKPAIGKFDMNMNIVPLKFYLNTPDNYLDYFNQTASYAIKEIRKLSKYTDLANKLDYCLNEVNEKVHSSHKSNKLNYNNELFINHSDLNSSNILIDPITFKLIGIIDWEWACYSFNDTCLDYFNFWIYEKKDEMKLLIRNKMKNETFNWYKKPNGEYVRKYYGRILSRALGMTSYSASNFSLDVEKQKLEVRKHIERNALELMDMLKDDMWKNFLRRIP